MDSTLAEFVFKDNITLWCCFQSERMRKKKNKCVKELGHTRYHITFYYSDLTSEKKSVDYKSLENDSLTNKFK